jgi:hypothetical protein
MKLPIILGMALLSGNALSEVTTLRLPESALITFDAPKMSRLKESNENGQYRFVASSVGQPDQRFNLSIHVEPADCRYGKALEEVARCFMERLDSMPGIVKETDRPSCERNRCDVLYVLSHKAGDRIIRQLNLNSMFVYGGKWVDVHLSVVNPVAEDAQRLARFATSLKFEVQPATH